MVRVLFVCHGNICRSPMAEFVLKDMVRRRGLQDSFHIESAATSYEEIGNDLYPPAKRELDRRGVPYSRHEARHIERSDYAGFDYIIGMDEWNVRNLRSFFPSDKDGKIHKLLDFTEHPHDIADPWYTDDFKTCFDDVKEGCEPFLESLSPHS